MGCCLSVDDDEEDDERRAITKGTTMSDAAAVGHCHKPLPGVSMGVAMMMQQAGAFMAPLHADSHSLEAQVRKAKAEGRTVTVMNNALYFDYQFIAYVPPGLDLRI